MRLLDRIHQLTVAQIQAGTAARPSCLSRRAKQVAVRHSRLQTAAVDVWVPDRAGHARRRAGLTDGEVEALILKTLNGRAEATGRYISEHLKLPFRIIDPLLALDEARSAGRA